MNTINAKNIGNVIQAGLTFCGVVILLGLSSRLASAQVISVQFSQDYNASVVLQADDVAGLNPVSHWNSYSANPQSGSTLSNLADSEGNATSVTGTYTGNLFGQVGATGSPTPDQKLFGGFLGSDGSNTGGVPVPETLTLTNIDYASYALIVYLNTNSPGAGAVLTLDGGAPQNGSVIANESFVAPDPFYSNALLGGGGNYIEFDNLTGLNQTLTFQTTDGTFAAIGIAGFQIVANTESVPEPSTWAMLLLGTVSIVALRRQSRRRA